MEAIEVVDTETPTGMAIRILHDLKQRAEAAGLPALIVRTGRTSPPALVVTNPSSRSLSEEITCRERNDGLWWLFWSWGEPICQADDLELATNAVRRVVTGRP
jgi:hypothetical protein